MKRSMFLLLMMATAIAFAPAANAQALPPPCNPLPLDRTITFCYPIDDATIAQSLVAAEGWIKDSLPHNANIYIDGQLQSSNIGRAHVCTSVTSGDGRPHTACNVVTDSQGSFRKSASFR